MHQTQREETYSILHATLRGLTVKSQVTMSKVLGQKWEQRISRLEATLTSLMLLKDVRDFAVRKRNKNLKQQKLAFVKQ